MRRLIPALALLELAASALLMMLVASAPSQEDVRLGFEGARGATAAAASEARIAAREVAAIRRLGLDGREADLEMAGRALAAVSEAPAVDFEALAALRDGLDRGADGLDRLAAMADPEAIAALGDELGDAADLIDDRVVPASLEIAERLEAASGPIGEGAERLVSALESATIDLEPLREIDDGLGRLDEGLEAVGTMVDPSRLEAIGEAAAGAQGVVDEAARLAIRAAGYSYPVVEIDGLTPRVRRRPFWPRADRVGQDLRKVAEGMEAMEGQAEAIANELPKILGSLEDGRRGLSATRKTLAVALGRREEIERILAELPADAAVLASSLPVLCDDLAAVLRGAERLGGLAEALRGAGRAALEARDRWPAIRADLAGSADVLRAASGRIDAAIEGRDRAEDAWNRLAEASAAASRALPESIRRVDARLIEQQRTLEAMALGIGQVDASLPAFERSLLRCLRIGRMLAVLVGLVAFAHGIGLLAGWLRRPAPSKPS